MPKSVAKLSGSLYVMVLVLGLGTTAGYAQDDYARAWGPQIGAVLPLLQAKDQSGQDQNLRSLTGKQGLLLFMNRSADW